MTATQALPPERSADACGGFDAAVLASTPLFGGLPDDCRCVFTDRMQIQPALANTYLFREGEPARDLYILARGRVALSKDGVTLIELKSGDFFGEVSFLDMQPRNCTAHVVEDAELYVIPYKSLRSLYEVNVRAYALIVMNLAREVCRRLRASDRLACCGHAAALTVDAAPVKPA